MRDLICGGCELADCDITDFSPLSDARREHLRTGRDSYPVFSLQSATSGRRDQPENARRPGSVPERSRGGRITSGAALN